MTFERRAVGGRSAAARRSCAPLLAVLSIALAGCSAAGTPTPPSPAGTGPTSAAGSMTAPTGGQGSAPELLVLAKTGSAVPALWTLDLSGSWAAVPGETRATALARDGQELTLGKPDGLEFRTLSQALEPGRSVAVAWGSGPSETSPACADTSDAGQTAVAIQDGDGIRFALTDAKGGSGNVTELSPSPSSPFGPSLAWLDSDRLAVLASDAMLVSHVAVVDSRQHSIVLLKALGGVRTFALSPDRQSLAAATESAVYVASVADWLAGTAPATVTAPDTGQVVWALALDSTGNRLAFLSGTLTATGDVDSVRDLAFERRDGSWRMILDAPAPFDTGAGQVWLT